MSFVWGMLNLIATTPPVILPVETCKQILLCSIALILRKWLHLQEVRFTPSKALAAPAIITCIGLTLSLIIASMSIRIRPANLVWQPTLIFSSIG